MDLLVWDERLELGVKLIDDQHRQLFEKIDELLVGSRRAGEKKETIDGFMAYLGAYIETHFRTEEGWMLDSAYPEYLAHKVAHDIFRAEISILMKDYEVRRFDSTLIDRVCETATGWLSKHIYQHDFAMAKWFREAGVTEKMQA